MRYAAETAEERKENRMMKVAVTYENGNVFPHFGHTEQFKVYDVKDGKISGYRWCKQMGAVMGLLQKC